MNTTIIEQFEQLVAQKRRELLKASDKERFHKSISLTQTQKVVRLLKQFPEEILGDVQLKRLERMKGVGKKSIERIREIIEKGRLKEIKITKGTKVTDRQLKQIEDLKQVINIGDATARDLVLKKKITSVAKLKKAHKDGKITLNDKILLGLKYHKKYHQNIPREEVLKIDNYINKQAKRVDLQLYSVICGSYRRVRPSSNDIDVLITHPSIKTKNQLIKMGDDNYLHQLVRRLEDAGFLLDAMTDKNFNNKYMGFCRLGSKTKIRRIDIRFVPRRSYYPALLYFTGSGDFNRRMREHAITLGFKLNEYGLFKKKDDGSFRKISVKSEKDIFVKLGMAYVEPVDRL